MWRGSMLLRSFFKMLVVSESQLQFSTVQEQGGAGRELRCCDSCHPLQKLMLKTQGQLLPQAL